MYPTNGPQHLPLLNGSTPPVSPSEGILYYPTGIELFDLDNSPGLVVGHVLHLFGDENAGKTTVALAAAGEMARCGWATTYIDWTGGIVPEEARQLGVPLEDTSLFALYLPETQKHGIEIARSAIAAGRPLVVFDGINASASGVVDADAVAEKTRLWAQELPLLKRLAGSSNSTILAMSRGNREWNPCGTTMKFMASRRIILERIGPEIRWEVLKDKLGRSTGRSGILPPLPTRTP